VEWTYQVFQPPSVAALVAAAAVPWQQEQQLHFLARNAATHGYGCVAAWLGWELLGTWQRARPHQARAAALLKGCRIVLEASGLAAAASLAPAMPHAVHQGAHPLLLARVLQVSPPPPPLQLESCCHQPQMLRRPWHV
jgi:hypothetical protein